MKMPKYPKVRRLGHRKTQGILDKGESITVLEKLDGQNFRFTYDEDTDMILYGSRNTLFKEHGNPTHFEDIGGTFQKGARYIEDNIDKQVLRDLNAEYGRIAVYGENMVKHTLEYDWGETPQFLGFDIWTENEGWLEHSLVEEIMSDLGLETAPIVEVIEDPTSWNRDYEVPESVYRDGQAEGVVLKRSTYTDENGSWRGSRAKLVSEEFEEVRNSSQGNSDADREQTDERELVDKYATDGRIRKHINKLTVDEGRELEMKLMEELPMRVVEDIWREEYEELVRTNKTINMKDFRSMVASECVPVLKSMTTEQAGN